MSRQLIRVSEIRKCIICGDLTQRRLHNAEDNSIRPCCERCFNRTMLWAAETRKKNTRADKILNIVIFLLAALLAYKIVSWIWF